MIGHETVCLDLKSARLGFFYQKTERFRHQPSVLKSWNPIQRAGGQEVPLRPDVRGTRQSNVDASEWYRHATLAILTIS
jgi:hypothetical protein